MKIYSFKGISPKIHSSAYLFDDVVIIGDVEIGAEASICPGVVIRGDKSPILVGARSNIQDNSILHSDPDFQIKISENVTIGHGCILHGCEIGMNAVVGMGSVVLNGANISANSLVSASSLVGGGPKFPEGSFISGNPAKVLMGLGAEDIQNLIDTAQEYVDLANEWRDNLQVVQF